MPVITPDRHRRFIEKTIPVPFSGCLIWLGGVNEHGYGVFWNGVRLEKAHRFALRAVGVDVPSSSDVCHTCDVPACVEANHLFVGDAQANVDDMWAKGRATVISRRGTSQAQAKLNDEKARQIRELWRSGGWKQRDLAELFGVSQRLIWNVIHGKNWTQKSSVLIVKVCSR